MTSKTFAAWAALTRAEFYAVALADSGRPALAEFATRKLYDSGFVARRAES